MFKSRLKKKPACFGSLDIIGAMNIVPFVQNRTGGPISFLSCLGALYYFIILMPKSECMIIHPC